MILDINTVLDLRSTDLSAHRCEYLSRIMELMLFTPASASESEKDLTLYRDLCRRQKKGERSVLIRIESSERDMKNKQKLYQCYRDTGE